MPDALSKTVPIWCYVLNRALFSGSTVDHDLHTPPGSVSRSEHLQISNRLDDLVKSFLVRCLRPFLLLLTLIYQWKVLIKLCRSSRLIYSLGVAS